MSVRLMVYHNTVGASVSVEFVRERATEGLARQGEPIARRVWAVEKSRETGARCRQETCGLSSWNARDPRFWGGRALMLSRFDRA